MHHMYTSMYCIIYNIHLRKAIEAWYTYTLVKYIACVLEMFGFCLIAVTNQQNKKKKKKPMTTTNEWEEKKPSSNFSDIKSLSLCTSYFQVFYACICICMYPTFHHSLYGTVFGCWLFTRLNGKVEQINRLFNFE